MKSLVILVIGVLLGAGMMLFVPHGTTQVVYAGGSPSGNGDVNGDGRIDIGDGIYIINYLLRDGPLPVAIECPTCPPSGVPATGQTRCYDNSGTVIDCASADFPGQDAVFQAGCPVAGRFVDNGNGTVTDNCTGLMWQKDTADVSGNGAIGNEDTAGWRSALQYCEALELAGHSDWRLPNVRELQSIIDYGRTSPSADPILGFGDFAAQAFWYWSSSTKVDNPGYAWLVDFLYGFVVNDEKAVGRTVRAVRDAL